jgi:hypothetical protein
MQEKNENRKPEKKPLLTHSIIFIDKSVSVNPNHQFISQKYGNIFKEIVQQNIHGKGDRIDVYYIHENTAKARVWSLTSKATIAAEDTINANPTDIEMIKNQYELTLQKEKKDFLKKCTEALNFLNDSKSNQSTDIWASLEVIDKLVKSDEKRVMKIYYLSDMIESMKATDRRDFHKTPPTTKEQAEKWAKEDFEKMQQYLDLDKFTNLEIKIALPFEPNSTVAQNNPVVTHYWETLFSLLGVEENVEEI